LAATALAILVLVRLGRKPLTLFGNLGLAICDILIGVFCYFSSWGPSNILVVVFLTIYMVIYGISLGPVVWLYVPEIIPAKVVPYATAMNWIGCSICIILTPIIINANDGNAYPVFFFFGGITLFFFIVNIFLMVETKNLST
jgi:hypothetical protein